jgi:aminopeptidase N
MYYKGANMLHTLRQLVDDDEAWRQILRGINSEFYHQTVTTKQIEDYISKTTKKDLSAFFNQYLRTTEIPTLEYEIKNGELNYRWINVVDGFDMPIKIEVAGKTLWLFPKVEWQTKLINNPSLVVNRNFYVETKKL